MKNYLIFNRALLFGFCAITTLCASSYIPLAAGATAGYIAHDEGYRVSNPIHKTH